MGADYRIVSPFWHSRFPRRLLLMHCARVITAGTSGKLVNQRRWKARLSFDRAHTSGDFVGREQFTQLTAKPRKRISPTFLFPRPSFSDPRHR
jgi:hypothetical protein